MTRHERIEQAARELLRTARPVVEAIRSWLSEDLCDCEMFHHCGVDITSTGDSK